MPLPSVPASEPLPLDIAAAEAAYGLRKLRSDYAGQLIRVRETGGNTQADIGADAAGNLDTAALLAHCGANDGHVVTWYDQSGNGINITNATTSVQPKIVSAGAIVNVEGRQFVHFAVDYLDGTAGTAISTSSSTVVAVLQSGRGFEDSGENKWLLISPSSQSCDWSTREDWVSIRTRNVANAQDQVRVDAADTENVRIIPSVVAVRCDNGTFDFFRNGLLLESLAATDHGKESTSFRVGDGTAGNSVYLSELLIYTSVLSDAQVNALYESINERHLVGPRQRIPRGSIVDRAPWDSVLRHWVDSIPASDLEVTGGDLVWDETYANTDVLYNLYITLNTVAEDTLSGLWSHTRWWKLFRDSQGAGLDDDSYEAPLAFRSRGSNANAWAAMYSISLPNAGDVEGNPFYQQRAVALRALVQAALGMIQHQQRVDQSPGVWNETDFMGGSMMAVTYPYLICRDVLPKHVQNAFVEGLYFAAKRIWLRPAHAVNSNMDCKAIAALAHIYNVVEDATRRAKILEAVKRILFGSTTGTPATSDITTGIYDPGGWIVEGETPETTYLGHSMYWLAEAHYWTNGFAEWSFLTTMLEAITTWYGYNTFVDPDGYKDGPSGYAGRTGNSLVADQGNSNAWRDAYIASKFTPHRQRIDPPDEATMVTFITDRLAGWSGNTNHSEVLNSGTAAAHTNGSLSSTVTLTNTPTLSLPSEPTYSSYLFLDTGGGAFARIASVDNTAKTVTLVTDSFNIPSGSPVDYRIEVGPRPYDAQDLHWPADEPYYPDAGFYDAQRARVLASDSTTKSPWENTATFNVSFDDKFWAYKNTDGVREFGWLVEALEDPGQYEGWFGGTIQQFWIRDTGTVICARHDKAGSSSVDNENTRVWSEMFDWATTHVCGVDDGDKRFSSACCTPVRISPATTFDINGTPKSVVTEGALDEGVTSGFEAGSTISGSFVVRNTFEALADGLRHLVEVEFTGSDDIKELWAVVPIYLRDTDQSMSDTTIEYWNGSAWASLSTSLVSTGAIRLMRNFGSGAKYAYIEFASSQSVKLNSAVSVQTYQGNSRHRMVQVDLLGYTGSAQAFPATASVDYSVVTTNPHP